jgi:8-oxo-dGTP diphosphatase
MANRPQIAVSTAVFRGDKVLVASRMAEPGAGLFSLPGGRVEWGETLEEAALREVFEEVQVRACLIGFVDHLDIRHYDGDGTLSFHAVLCVFAAVWCEGEGVTGAEAGEIRWIADESEMAGLPVTQRLGEVIGKARRVLEAHRCGT